MIRKNLLFKIFCIFLLCFSIAGKVKADHLGAMDIFVDWKGKYHGDYTYKVTLIIYRACAYQNLHFSNQTQLVTVTSRSCGYTTDSNTQINLTVDTAGNGAMQIVDQLCPSFHNINSCYDPQYSPWPAFEKWTYTAYVTLPKACSDWTFSFQSCCRNLAVTNLVAGGIYVSTIINNLANDSVSSPRFYVDPIPYLCAGQNASFFNGPVDPDGDSIITINQIPLQGPNLFDTNQYNPGYSIDSPIGSTTPYIVNPLTGVATFKPSAAGKYIIAFTTKKYDPVTGVFLGSAERDVQVSVLNCASPPPSMDTTPINVVNGLLKKGNIIVACPGSELAFDVKAKSQSSNNSLIMGIDTGVVGQANHMSGVNFTTAGQGTSTPVSTFKWTPTTADLGPHVAIITATDSTCTAAQPIVFKSYMVVTILVYSGIVALPDTFYTCAFGKPPVTLSVSYYPGFTYAWTNYDSVSTDGITDPESLHPSVSPVVPTQYIVSSPGWPTGCRHADTVLVIVDTTTHIKISPEGTALSPIILCQPGLLHLSSTASGIQPYTNYSCGAVDTALTTHDAGATRVVPENGNYQMVLDPYVTPFGAFHSSHHQYLLKATDMKKSHMYSSSLTGIAFNVYALSQPFAATYDSVTIGLKCTTLPLDPKGAFATGTTQVFAAPVTIPAPGYYYMKFYKAYNWDTTQDIIVDVCFYNKGNRVSLASFVNFYKTPYPATIANVTKTTGDVCAGAAPDTVIKPLFQLPDIQLFYDHAPLAPWSYNWIKSYGSNLLSDSTRQDPDLWVSQSTKYLVFTRGRSTCLSGDSIYIYLDEHSATISPVDTSICIGRSVPITVYGGKSYKWYQNGFDNTTTVSCTDCAAAIAKPLDTTRYTVVISDSVNCADTLYSNVNILALPVFSLTPHDTIIKYGASVRLKATNDTLDYVWSPISTLDDPYSSAPVAKPFEPTVYTVVGSLNNCSWTDTVKVGIDYSANLLVPSVFSPNHDGKNDRFRVAGLTFQKVIEFRVFNRMGQELYNATDNEGWDGTFNKEEQDIDTYFYFIRVAYPDGYIQNFKGDVTLLR